MDCPRCASDNEKIERFCWLCGWDFTKGSDICRQCGLEIKEDEQCVTCDPTAGWMPRNEDDE